MRTKHGQAIVETPEYGAWKRMNQRCNNEHNPDYEHYGARGIRVCKRWSGKHGAEHFLSDMGPKPSSQHMLERINNNGNYTPRNCKWATRSEQMKNRRPYKIKRV